MFDGRFWRSVGISINSIYNRETTNEYVDKFLKNYSHQTNVTNRMKTFWCFCKHIIFSNNNHANPGLSNAIDPSITNYDDIYNNNIDDDTNQQANNNNNNNNHCFFNCFCGNCKCKLKNQNSNSQNYQSINPYISCFVCVIEKLQH